MPAIAAIHPKTQRVLNGTSSLESTSPVERDPMESRDCICGYRRKQPFRGDASHARLLRASDGATSYQITRGHPKRSLRPRTWAGAALFAPACRAAWSCYSNGSCARDGELLPIGLCPHASIEPLRPRSRMTESRGWTWT